MSQNQKRITISRDQPVIFLQVHPNSISFSWAFFRISHQNFRFFFMYIFLYRNKETVDLMVRVFCVIIRGKNTGFPWEIFFR